MWAWVGTKFGNTIPLFSQKTYEIWGSNTQVPKTCFIRTAERDGNGDWSQNPNQPVRSIDMSVLGWVVLLCTKEFFIRKSFSKKWQSDFFHTLQAAKVTIQNLDNLQSKFKGKSAYFLVILCKRFNCRLWNTKLIQPPRKGFIIIRLRLAKYLKDKIFEFYTI